MPVMRAEYTAADPSKKPTGVASTGPAAFSSVSCNSPGWKIRGWSKAELNDIFHVDLISTYAEMKWCDNGSSVSDGHDSVAWCDNFSQTGWVIDSCSAVWSPSGPSNVWIQTTGDFHNDLVCGGGCARTLKSWLVAQGSFNISMNCSQTPSNSPPGTIFFCQNFWEVVN